VTGLRPKDDIEQSDGDEATGGSIAPLGLSRYWVRQGDCARSYSCAEESSTTFAPVGIPTQTIQILFVFYCQPVVTGTHEKGVRY
jgi:hypothetical protein